VIQIQRHQRGFSFKIFVQPKSSKNVISGIYRDALKLKLTAPPVDGAANKMCIKFLAKCLRVSKSSLEIISGKTSRTKHILLHCNKDQISGIQERELRKKIQSLIIRN
jgi:uncharacterized protein